MDVSGAGRIAMYHPAPSDGYTQNNTHNRPVLSWKIFSWSHTNDESICMARPSVARARRLGSPQPKGSPIFPVTDTADQPQAVFRGGNSPIGPACMPRRSLKATKGCYCFFGVEKGLIVAPSHCFTHNQVRNRNRANVFNRRYERIASDAR